jgi:hypothetical protein
MWHAYIQIHVQNFGGENPEEKESLGIIWCDLANVYEMGGLAE